MVDQIHATLSKLVVPIEGLVPYGKNPRRGDVDAIAESLTVNGQYKPIVVRAGSNEVLAGNHTLKAARQLGWDKIAVTFVDVDDDGAARIVLVDNRTNDVATYDEAALAELLSSLPDLTGTGFGAADLDEMLGIKPDALNDSDDTPEPPAEPVSVLGDVWVLGEHRVVCGDATDVGAWDAILGKARPSVVFTDPPYGIGYQAMRGGAKIENDATPNEALQVTRDALALVHDAEVHFVCCDWRSLGTILDAMAAAAIKPKSCIVWDKQTLVQNLDRYAKQHEFIVYAGPFGGQPTMATDVWPHRRDFDPDHPTPKPVSLIIQALTTASAVGALVADPFGGSGSTLIACHDTNRVARLIELDPRYVDVICRRYQEHTGDKPVLESTGEPHDFTTKD